MLKLFYFKVRTSHFSNFLQFKYKDCLDFKMPDHVVIKFIRHSCYSFFYTIDSEIKQIQYSPKEILLNIYLFNYFYMLIGMSKAGQVN